MINTIGYMQGRLSPIVNGMIQAFPWEHWEKEFPLAEAINISAMEWTLDQEGLYENPLLTESGQERIIELCAQHKLTIPSLTGDCFMQAPYWKASGEEGLSLRRDFLAIAKACSKVGIELLVVPLVDNGSITTPAEESTLIEFLEEITETLRELGVRVSFESDFPPHQLAEFIAKLDSSMFGVNYDIGNSAALGYSPEEEFSAYGERIVNVHVKDRPLDGTTVPLGGGDADFTTVFRNLKRIGYEGNCILQTARASDDRHSEVLASYRDMVRNWLAD